MKVEVISIGDELLIGQTVNTNASWIGTAMREIGADIEYGTVIRDQPSDMVAAFSLAFSRADVILVTGGLGPTKDDITKKVLCDYFQVGMREDEKVLEHVRSFFETRGREMLDVNRLQAQVPSNAKALHNEVGTAPGMWFEHEGKILVSMPGVPYEMKYLMSAHVIPLLRSRFQLEGLVYKTLQLQGIGESYIADKIKDIEDDLRANNFGLAYLPSPGLVRLRVSARDTAANRKAIDVYLQKVAEMLPKAAYGYEEERLEEVVGALLRERKETVTTIESCTGGLLSASITSVPGASDYFNGALVAYSYGMKTALVGVSEETLQKHGAVSQQTVEEMARGARDKMEATYAIAVSGIAGPSGGMESKPVGTVWIAIAGPNRVISKTFIFEKDRERNIRRSVLTALNLLRCEILGLNLEKS